MKKEYLECIFVEEMKRVKIECGSDIESAHLQADELLVEVLQTLGMSELVKAYNEIDKCYA